MDNLTHTLIGVIAGEGLAQAGFARRRRTACIALVAIGSNLPDLDLLYSYGRFGQGKLDYMLEHRGHTHTVVGCLALAAALYLLAWLWLRRRAILGSRDHLLLAGAALLGTMLHLSMDALNSYGVHPFWPVENRWYYGDSVFIVEPLYWAAAAPLMFVFRSIVARVLLGLVLAAAIGLSALSGLVPPALYIALATLIAVLLTAGSRASPRTSVLVSVGVVLGVTTMFVTSGSIAVRRVDAIAASHFAAEEVIDRVLTPMPVNPLCWDLLLLQRHGDRYTARHAMLSLAPWLVRAEKCPARPAGARQTAPQTAVSAADTQAIRWLGEFGMDVSTLRAMVRTNCMAARAMQFVRAPFVAELNGTEVIGDLRYDREPGPGFTEFELGLPAASMRFCPGATPWIAPRADLLRAEIP